MYRQILYLNLNTTFSWVRGDKLGIPVATRGHPWPWSKQQGLHSQENRNSMEQHLLNCRLHLSTTSAGHKPHFTHRYPLLFFPDIMTVCSVFSRLFFFLLD